MLRKWDELPEFMKCHELRPYYENLARKRIQLSIKRGFDCSMAVILLILFAIPMLVIGITVKLDSEGPVIFRQKRVTAYGKCFSIHKFRTMYVHRHDTSNLTSEDDRRITKTGKFLRKTRLDELPQLLDVLSGHMSFVGTRPEVPEYVKAYTKEMYATLLLPAGITGRASIRFKDEAVRLRGLSGEERSKKYIEEILPEKMKDNLYEILHFSVLNDLRTLVRTVRCFL